MKKLFFYFVLFTTGTLFAQHLGYCVPAGAQQGTSVDVILGGQNLWAAKTLTVSGQGVRVDQIEFLRYFPNVPWYQKKYLLDTIRAIRIGGNLPEKPKLSALQTWYKHPYWDNDLSKLSPVQTHLLLEKLLTQPNPLQESPAIAQLIIAKIHVDKGAAPGRRELRLIGKKVGNPTPFYIGKSPEIREPYRTLPQEKRELPLFTPPSVLNGQIMPGGETDSYQFYAQKGKKITFRVLARTLNPFIGDGVPGFFQPVIEVFDRHGKTAAYADDFYFDPDPVLTFVPNETGIYRFSIRDSIYRGRADFVYRVEVFPGEPKRRIDSPGNNWAHDVFRIPCEIKKYPLKAEKNQRCAVEIMARRLGSPVDSYLEILDKAGNVIAENDDFKRPLVGQRMHHADSYLLFTAPETGDYTVQVREITGKSGPDYEFFLRCGVPRPDFKVYSAQSAFLAGFGGYTPLKLLVERMDGFKGEIQLKLKANPTFSIAGASSIPSEADSSEITLYAKPGKFLIEKVELWASCGNLRRKVIPCDEAMQAFAYTHWVPSDDFYLFSYWKYPALNLFSWNKIPEKIMLSNGKNIRLKISHRALKQDVTLAFQLRNSPKGLRITEEKHNNKEITLLLSADQCLPGKYNQIVEILYSYDVLIKKNKKKRRETSVIPMPAFHLELKGE